MSTTPHLECPYCPHHCRLAAGVVGRCRARWNDGEKITSRVGDRTTALTADPIEKKPLFHFLPGSQVLSFGTVGCNFSCDCCQNAALVYGDLELLANNSVADVIAAAQRHNCESVAFTYNEPIVWSERVMRDAVACREANLRTVVVTNGFIANEHRHDFFANIDAANVDLKSFQNEFYKKQCGGELDAVLTTLQYLARETSVWLEVTVLLIPGINDSDTETASLAAWCRRELGAEVPIHFSAFRPAHRMPHHTATPLTTLHRARQIARDAGLVYVYTGNHNDPLGQATLCPQCGQTIIERGGFTVVDSRIDADGCCPMCGSSVAGIFH